MLNVIEIIHASCPNFRRGVTQMACTFQNSKSTTKSHQDIVHALVADLISKPLKTVRNQK